MAGKKAVSTTKPDDPLAADFRNFLFLVWKHLGLPEPTEAQYDIASFLQGGPKRRVIMAFRGVGKSWITCAYACWRLYNNPDYKILILSASKDLADNNSKFIKDIINRVPFLSHLAPKEGQRDSNIQFDVGPARISKDPSVKSVGITGQITGTRADEIIADDIEVPRNSATQMMRDKLSEQVKEFDAILKPGGTVTYLGTPQTEMSLYNQLPERGYTIRVWPAHVPTEAQMAAYGERLAPYIRAVASDGSGRNGLPTDPKRFSQEDLLERLTSYGKSGYALQFMLDTSLSDANKYPLKLSDLVVMDLDAEVAPLRIIHTKDPSCVINDLPMCGFTGDKFYRPVQMDKDFAPYTGKVLVVDPSGRGQDETTWAVLFFLHGYVFLMDLKWSLDGYDEAVLRSIAATAKQWKVNGIIVEANFGDGMFSALLTPVLGKIYPCSVEEVKHSKQKELRIIDTLEPVMNSHKLIVNRKVIEEDYKSLDGRPQETSHQYLLQHQMTRITKERGALRRDDRLDVVAMGVAFWVEHMAQDSDVQASLHKQEVLQKDLDKFMSSFGLDPQQRDLWVRV